jgi:hypothetical protein
MKRGFLAAPTLLSTLAVLAGCTMPFRGSPESESRVAHAVTESVKAPATIIQVRTYWGAPTITVVAWDEEDEYFGLRSTVTRTGELVGGNRRGDHQLYMSAMYGDNLGGFTKAAIMPQERKLASGGGGRDLYACFYGRSCSPTVTRSLSIPDSILRANRDSLVVTFFPREYEPWTITLHRELIDAYLHKVDSVVSLSRRVASR